MIAVFSSDRGVFVRADAASILGPAGFTTAGLPSAGLIAVAVVCGTAEGLLPNVADAADADWTAGFEVGEVGAACVSATGEAALFADTGEADCDGLISALAKGALVGAGGVAGLAGGFAAGAIPTSPSTRLICG